MRKVLSFSRKLKNIKNVCLLILFISVFILPVFSEELIKVGNSFDGVVYVDKDSVKNIDQGLYNLQFNTKTIFDKGQEENIDGKKATYETWDVKVNCKTYDFHIETMKFYDKENKLLLAEKTDGMPFVTFKGKASPGSNIFKLLVTACQYK